MNSFIKMACNLMKEASDISVEQTIAFLTLNVLYFNDKFSRI